VERTKDLVLKARKRCDVTHAKDAEVTAAWYADLKNETGERVLAGMCDTIEGGPFG
jgi:FAD-dependent urate hydroxylase